MGTNAMNDQDFNDWCDQFDAIGRERGCDFDYTLSAGRENWRDMFKRGFTPAEALDEEFSAAAADIE